MTMQLPLIGKVRQPAPWLVGLVAVGLLGTGTATYLTLRSQSAAPDIASMTVPVESKSLQVRITASGTVQPIQTVNLSPKNSGILQKLLVEQGDRVTKGQVIARMQNDDLDAQLMQAQARVAQMQARLAEQKAGNRPQEISQAQAKVAQAEALVAQAQAKLNLADQKIRRNRSLADEGAISRDRLDEIQNDGNTARATLEQEQASLQEARRNLDLMKAGSRVEDIADAEGQLQEAIGNLKAVQVKQDDTLIRAPFDGIVTQKYATEGAFVTPTTSASDASSATSTAIVALAEGLEVLADVPEVDIQQLKVGQSVEVVADAYPSQVFKGRVRLIAPEAVVKQNVTSFQVRIALVTGQDKLLSGMNADVTFLGDQINGAVVVPTVAIVTKAGETGVLVPDQANKPQFRPVTLGAAIGNQTQIVDGIKSGERVFTDIPPGSDWDKANKSEG